MAAGGVGGKVTTIHTTATGTSVTVSFPSQDGPPVIPAHIETYDPCPDPWLRRFENAKPPSTVDVTVDGDGHITDVIQRNP